MIRIFKKINKTANNPYGCKEITNINDVDYASCEISFEDNTAKVRISCTIPINNDGKTDFNNILTDGTIKWSKGIEKIFNIFKSSIFN